MGCLSYINSTLLKSLYHRVISDLFKSCTYIVSYNIDLITLILSEQGSQICPGKNQINNINIDINTVPTSHTYRPED